MRILLIGATGFIGPSVVSELLRLGHDLAVLHRGTSAASPPGVRQIVGDRQRLHEAAADIRTFRPDVVVDLILSSGRQAAALIDVCRGIVSRVVALSSMDVYRACGVLHGLEPGGLEPLPLTESSPLRSRLQTYPPSQIEVLKQVFGWVDDEYDKIPVERTILGDPVLPGTVLRLPMVYGPGDPLHRFLPIVKRIADGRRVLLFSDQMAQWRATKGYVEDVGAAIARAAVAEATAGGVYNVGEADTLTELEWGQLIAREMKWSGELAVLPDAHVPPHLRAPGNAAQHWVADTSRIRRELGFSESIPREEAIRRTIAWERTVQPGGFAPHVFDYASEDAVVRTHVRSHGT